MIRGDGRAAVESGWEDQLDAVGNLIVRNADAELARFVLHFFLKEELPQNLLCVVRLQHGRDLIALLDLVELLANLSDGDGLIANLGDGVAGSRQCHPDLSAQDRGACRRRSASTTTPRKMRERSFCVLFRAASHPLNPPSPKQTQSL